jgi:dTDP-4-amino-4,6-dideoxygalactose transaminase
LKHFKNAGDKCKVYTASPWAVQEIRDFIPLIKPSVGERELREVRVVMQSGWLSQGPKVKEFETKLASFIGAKHVVATSSCTTALSLALESLVLQGRSEVVVPDFTFPAAANVVLRYGATPVLADIRLSTFAIRPSQIGRGMSKKTSAVMPVHPFGHPFEMEEIYEIADKNGLHIIEDAATALGTKYHDKHVGSRGEAVCFSFHPRKLLTTGEGGCLATDSDEVFERARALRNHGQVHVDGRNDFILNGLNYRMSDVHAAIGVAQLSRLDIMITKRRRQAEVYKELLSSSKLDLTIPAEQHRCFHTYQSYVVLLGRSFPPRNSCITRLRSRFSIETQVGTYSVKSQEAFRALHSLGALKQRRIAFERSLTLPLYESLTEEQQSYIVEALSRLVKT